MYPILANSTLSIVVLPGAEQNTFQVVVPIAGAENATSVVSVVSTLSMLNIPGDSHWKFSFAIVVDYLNGGGRPIQTSNREIAAQFIPPSVRPRIMQVVCDALLALVDHVRPPYVVGVAEEQHPAVKWLRKYLLLINALETKGYALDQNGTDGDGRPFWAMRRVSTP